MANTPTSDKSVRPDEPAQKNSRVEDMIDEALDESFPASDPPNLASIARMEKLRQERLEKEEAEKKKSA